MATTGVNDVSAFMPSLVASGLDIQKLFAQKHNLIRAVDVRIAPDDGRVWKTLTIPYDKDNTTGRDAAAGDFEFQDLDSDEIVIVLNKNAQDGFQIRSFEQATTPADLAKFYLQPAVEKVIRQIKGSLVSLINTTNFTNGTPGYDNTGGTSNVISVDKFLAIRGDLSNLNIPTDDVEDMSFVMPSIPYNKHLGQSDWSAATSVGGSIAESIRLGGSNPIAFATQFREDQGLNSLTTGSGGTTVYKGFVMHRSAIALASCYQPKPGDNVKWFDMPVLGLPLRVMMSYDHKKAAYLVSVNCQYGVAVGRPKSGSVVSFKTTP